MLLVGLNPYGTNYTIGLQGAGRPRANPRPAGLDGFLALAEEMGARSIELDLRLLPPLDSDDLTRLRDRLESRGMLPVLSAGPSQETVQEAILYAKHLGARAIRMGLTGVLCGDRAAEPRWLEIVAGARLMLRRMAHIASDHGLSLAIEDHQDFTSAELIELCGQAGPGVGICFDTANPLAVGEEPIAFTRAVASLVRHVHLKDYRAHWSDVGYRLVSCATGDGAIPIREMADILLEHQAEMTASIEVGALNARHIRLFTPAWWQGYPPRTAQELAPALAAARVRRLPDDAEWRTPWELEQEPQAIIDHELALFRKSVLNVKRIGLM